MEQLGVGFEPFLHGLKQGVPRSAACGSRIVQGHVAMQGHAQRQSPADIGGGGAKLGLKPLGNGLQGREADLTVTLNA